MKPKTQQFILLPARGMSGAMAQTQTSERFFLGLNQALASSSVMSLGPAKRKAGIRVLDSIHENGAKLVEIEPESLAHLRATQPGVRVVPVTWYFPMRRHRFAIEAKVKTAAAAPGVRVRVTSQADGSPVAGATVVAFVNFVQRAGAGGITNPSGYVTLKLSGASRKLQRLYIYPHLGFWGLLRRNVTLTADSTFKLTPVELGYRDALRNFYGAPALTEGSGVTVGVVDTGVGPHPDLAVAGGVNTVTGENPNDYADSGAQHGTHVAGIIAGRGSAPNGMRGMAPAVTLRSYRVFGKDAKGASNFAIAKAVDRAAADGCDLINMSLGGGPADPATTEAISEARAKGALVLVATGNDGRQDVSFPAALSDSLAINALGRKGTFPVGTPDADEVRAPFGKDKNNFVAGFSNIGPEVDAIAPGVGIISTVPGGYAPMSGTSMACPAATGVAARILAQAHAVLAMPRDAQRSEAMAKLLAQHAEDMGFTALYQGEGMLS